MNNKCYNELMKKRCLTMRGGSGYVKVKGSLTKQNKSN